MNITCEMNGTWLLPEEQGIVAVSFIRDDADNIWFKANNDEWNIARTTEEEDKSVSFDTRYGRVYMRTVTREGILSGSAWRKPYYKLPLDQYGQPKGYVETIYLTEDEFRKRRDCEWIYEDEIDAYYRAID